MGDKELREAGLKVTVPRIKIMQILESAKDHHLTAEDVYKILLEGNEDVGLATVYRVLTQFEAAGLVTRHYFEGGLSVFELSQGDHHDHLVCVQCHKVVEFVDPVIETRQTEIAKRYGFRMTDHSLHIYGICPECDKKSK